LQSSSRAKPYFESDHFIGGGSGYGTFLLGRKTFKTLHDLFNLVACFLVVLIALVPTVVITFFALAGGFWIAKSL
jgi:hypothetical protein